MGGHLVELIIDEIALEGLYGITIEGFLKRISLQLNVKLPFPLATKSYFWSIIRQLKDIQIYELPEARKNLVIFDRYKYLDPDSESVIEPDEVPEIIYPYFPVKDEIDKGSCKDYKTRIDVTEEIKKIESIEELEKKWGNKIVLVARQEVRSKALLGTSTNLESDFSMSIYCLLEHIGRSRYHGETTLGKVSLQSIEKDPKTLYYNRKVLCKKNLITVQPYYGSNNGRIQNGNLFHLTRFYVERKPANLEFVEQVIEFLKAKPNCVAPVSMVVNELGSAIRWKKILKLPELRKLVNSNICLMYRDVYPDAKESEWKQKNSKEKIIRCVQLLDPNIDVNNLWKKEEIIVDDEENEVGVFDQREKLLDRTLVHQSIKIIEAQGSKGASQVEISQLLAETKLHSRAICKHLSKRNYVKDFMVDKGRQRTKSFVSVKHFNDSNSIKELQKESNKIIKRKLATDHNDSVNKKPKVEDPIKINIEESVVKNEKNLETLNLVKAEVKIVNKIPGFNFPERGFKDFSSELKYMKIQSNSMSSSITFRVLKRANLILNYVKEKKIAVGIIKLTKLIIEEEFKDGYNVTICKKSLIKLLYKLSNDGYVKIILIDLTLDLATRSVVCICDPSIEIDDLRIKSIIETEKLKFIVTSKHLKSSLASPIKKKINSSFQYNERAGFKYGFCPKFIRMKLLHQFLFYLVYEQNAFEGYSKSETIEFLNSQNINVNEQTDIPTMYHKDISWKMFVSPLPVYNSMCKGWVILWDVVHRLPLSLFVKLVTVNYIVPELEVYINDKIKKHYLIKDLPDTLRDILYHARRYIYHLYDDMKLLCYSGLVQFSFQLGKAKDDIPVYFNKKASLLNTETSERGYNEVTDKEYETIYFNFESSKEVERYWFLLWTICINTKLGFNNSVKGRNINIEPIANKEEMRKAIEPCAVDEAPKRDNGSVPGNHKGAAGLDTSFFAHLKRNWSWFNHTSGPTEMKTTVIKKDVIQQKRFEKKVVAVKKSFSQTQNKKDIKLLQGISKAKRTRKLAHQRSKPQRKLFYDEIDKQALKQLVTTRVTWNTEEDSLLLLCKVVMTYLFPQRNLIFLGKYRQIRDILYRVTDSKNKTSKACQRRINYMMKNPKTKESVTFTLEEIKQFSEVQTLRKIMTSKNEDVIFVETVLLLSKIYYGPKKNQMNIFKTIPDNLEQLYKKFKVIIPESVGYKIEYSNPKTINDIQASVVRSVIHSSLCCAADKTNWNYQLLNIYQNYSENLLKSVLMKIRKQQMISIRKNCQKVKYTKDVGYNAPFTSYPYQLSVTYLHKFITKHPYKIFHQLYVKSVQMSKHFISTKDSFEIMTPDGGLVALVSQLLTDKRFVFSLAIPDQVILLNTDVENKDFIYEKMSECYKEMNDTLSELGNEDGSLQSDVKSVTKSENIKKSRIHFMIRKEIADSLEGNSQTQHIHDYFLVNASKVSIKFNLENNYEEKQLLEIISKYDKNVYENILNDIRRFSIVPDLIMKEGDILTELKKLNLNLFDIECYQTLIEYIKHFHDFGVTFKDIQENCPASYHQTLSLIELINLLCSLRIIYKCGVAKIVFVHHLYIEHWCIKTVKMKRLERENLKRTIDSEVQSIKKKHKLENNNNGQNDVTQETENSSSKEKDFEDYLKNSSTSEKNSLNLENIKVILQPWVRIDGSVNKRVLDRWLGVILNYCMANPGITIKKICDRFPFLKPTEVITLIEYLKKLGCVQCIKVKKTKISLFSKKSSIEILPATGFEDIEDICIDLDPFCVSKLGNFIGDKQYTSDFAS